MKTETEDIIVREKQINEKQYDIAVIIGRFQVPELHDAHKALISPLYSKYKKLVIFLGIAPVINTRRNPLDYETRKLMIEEEYPKAVVLPIPDINNDQLWSQRVDDRIREIYPRGEVVLYGGRDSFIPHYKGKFDTKELVTNVYISGTEFREHVSKETKASKDYRIGLITAAYSRYPLVIPTVDIAIVDFDKRKFLLGRKANEDKYRFIGGHVDATDNSLEHAARRETYEETGVEASDFKYIHSELLENEWRYKNEEDKIMTSFFICSYMYGPVKPNDDIVELKWFDIDDIYNKDNAFTLDVFRSNNIVDVHYSLFNKLIQYFIVNDVLNINKNKDHENQ